MIQQGFDERNQVSSIAPAGAGPLAQYQYDAAGRRSGVTLANGVLSSYAYDAAGRLTALSHALNTAAFSMETYCYDGGGRRKAVTRADGRGDAFSYENE